MKTLIFGSGGQVGQALQGLAPSHVEITALGTRQLNLLAVDSVAGVIRENAPELIINAAGFTAVDKAESAPINAQRLNCDAPGIMARIAAEIGARFIHISTDFVFDGEANLPYRPDAPTNPLNVYGASKAAGEAAVAGSGANALTVRTAWVYSAGGANFVETMLRLMATQDEIRVVADQVGTPTHADSLARALWALAETDFVGITHFTDAGLASWYDFAVSIQDLAQAAGLLDCGAAIRPVPTKSYQTAARRPAYSVLDKSQCWSWLGAPANHWRHELAAMIMKKRTTQ